MDNDPRLACPFCAQLGNDVQCIALAPQHTGGDVDVAATWVPVCADHLDGWFDDVTDDERLPIIPRDGVMLTPEQARSILAATREDNGDNRLTINYEVDGLDGALDSLDASLRALDAPELTTLIALRDDLMRRLEAQGGRGVELADEIDALNERIDQLES